MDGMFETNVLCCIQTNSLFVVIKTVKLKQFSCPVHSNRLQTERILNCGHKCVHKRCTEINSILRYVASLAVKSYPRTVFVRAETN